MQLSVLEEQKLFIEYLSQKIYESHKLCKIYKEVIPLIQEIKKLQQTLATIDKQQEHNNAKDIILKIKKYNESIQLNITNKLLELLDIMNKYKDNDKN